MKIDYIELPSTDMQGMKAFYGAAFGWTFEDWGPEYVAFSNAGIEGGFRLEKNAPPRGGTIVILNTDDLEHAERAVVEAGGEILSRHDFPGGQRFHFADPTGNELAIWTKA